MSNKGNKKLHLHMHKTYHKKTPHKLYEHSKLKYHETIFADQKINRIYN